MWLRLRGFEVMQNRCCNLATTLHPSFGCRDRGRYKDTNDTTERNRDLARETMHVLCLPDMVHI